MSYLTKLIQVGYMQGMTFDSVFVQAYLYRQKPASLYISTHGQCQSRRTPQNSSFFHSFLLKFRRTCAHCDLLVILLSLQVSHRFNVTLRVNTVTDSYDPCTHQLLGEASPIQIHSPLGYRRERTIHLCKLTIGYFTIYNSTNSAKFTQKQIPGLLFTSLLQFQAAVHSNWWQCWGKFPQSCRTTQELQALSHDISCTHNFPLHAPASCTGYKSRAELTQNFYLWCSTRDKWRGWPARQRITRSRQTADISAGIFKLCMAGNTRSMAEARITALTALWEKLAPAFVQARTSPVCC